MTRHRDMWLPGLLALSVTGCASVARPPAPVPNQGSASYRRVDDSKMAHYALSPGDTAMGGSAIRRVLPGYPATQLAACVPVVTVQVQVIVDTMGKASDVRSYPVSAVAGAAYPPPFLDAVRAAVMQWQFAPLQISHRTVDTDGNTHEASGVTKPFSLVYAFRFACHAGKATVSATSPG